MLQNLAFNGPRQIDAAGSFFRYESGSAGGGNTAIRVKADRQDLGTYLPGDWVRIPFNASTWEVHPITNGCIGEVRIGVGEVGSSRLVGTVESIDGGRVRTLNGTAVAARDSSTATATNVPFVQLWNPAGSGRRVLIKSLVASISAAGDVFHGFVSSQLTPGAPLRQKISSGGSGVSRLQTGAYPTATWTANLATLWQQTASTTLAVPMKFDEPVIVEPNAGYALVLNVDAGTLRGTFEAVEEFIA